MSEDKAATVKRRLKGCTVRELQGRDIYAPQTRLLTVVGPKTKDVLGRAGLGEVMEQRESTHAHATYGFAETNRPVMCCKTNEFSGKGVGEHAAHLVVDEGIAGQVFGAILKAGAVPVGTEAIEVLMNER